MLDRRVITGISIFIIAGLIIFSFANPAQEEPNPSNNNSTDVTPTPNPSDTDTTTDGTNEPTTPTGGTGTTTTVNTTPSTTTIDPLAQAITNATNAVVQAESSLSQQDVTTARDLVNALPDGSTKDALNQRLDNVQAIIDLNNAIANAAAAVETAEDTLLQVDVNTARDLVNALPEGTIKDSLIERLDNVQAIINLNTAKADAIAELNAYVIAKDETLYSTANWDIILGFRNSGIDNINAATTTVEITTALNDAKTNIDGVKTITQVEADALAAAKTSAIAALTAYKNDSTLYSPSNWIKVEEFRNAGFDAINAATTVADVTIVLNIAKANIDSIETLAEEFAIALSAVETAEASLLQSDLDAARDLVNILPGGTEKDTLSARLDAVQAIIDLNNVKADAIAELNAYVIAKDETLYSTANWNIVLGYRNSGIDNINAATTITGITNALNTAKANIDSVKTIAQEEADALAAAKTAAILELTNYKNDPVLYNPGMWQKVEEYRTDGFNAINTATTVADVTTVLYIAKANIDSVKTLAEEFAIALSAVETAEASLLQSDVDAARDLVNVLPGGPAKETLNTRLDAVQAIIDLNNAKANAIAELNAYVIAKDETLYSTANWDIVLGYRNSGIDSINAATTITGITNALNDAKANIDSVKTIAQEEADALAAATQAVEKAETSLLQSDIDAAWDLVNALPNSIEKTNLINRLNATQAIIDLEQAIQAATEAVEKAEVSLLQSDINAAWLLVTPLPDGTIKIDLTNRLNEVQAIIDLDGFKQAAIDYLNSFVSVMDSSLYSTTNWNMILEYRDNGIAAIQSATTESNVQTILNDTIQSISLVATIAQEQAYQALITDALNKLAIVERTFDNDDFSAASNAVNLLKSSELKTSLLVRINQLQTIFNNHHENKFSSAVKALETAEKSKDPKEIAAVQKKINDLETLNSDYTSYYVVLQLKARLVLLLGR